MMQDARANITCQGPRQHVIMTCNLAQCCAGHNHIILAGVPDKFIFINVPASFITIGGSALCLFMPFVLTSVTHAGLPRLSHHLVPHPSQSLRQHISAELKKVALHLAVVRGYWIQVEENPKDGIELLGMFSHPSPKRLPSGNTLVRRSEMSVGSSGGQYPAFSWS